jgi:HK97 family phage portal protein
MSLFYFYKRKPEPEKQDVEKALSPQKASLTLGSSNTGHASYAQQEESTLYARQVYWSSYSLNTWVNKAVQVRANAGSKEWRLNPINGEAKADDIATAPIEAFLNQPNPQDNLHSLLFKIQRDLIIFGCCFLEMQTTASANQNAVKKSLSALYGINNVEQLAEDIVGEVASNGIPTFLRVLPNQTIEVNADERGNVIKYTQWNGNIQTVLQSNEVIHFVSPRSQNPLYGESELQSLGPVIGADNLVKLRQVRMLESDSAIDTLFSLPEGTTTDEVRKFHEAISNQYKLQNSKGRFLVTTEEVKYQDIAKTKDADFLELCKKNKEEIVEKLGVPLSVLGDSQSGLSASSDGDLRNFIENTVRPLNAYVEAIFNREVMALYQNIGLFYELEIVIDDNDDMSELEISWNNRINNGTMTRNEYRAKIGEDSIGPDGDVFTVQTGASCVSLNSIIDPPPPEPPPVVMQAPGSVSTLSDDPQHSQEPKPSPKAKEALKKAKLQELLREIKKAQESDY